jgi:hypothetical protein
LCEIDEGKSGKRERVPAREERVGRREREKKKLKKKLFNYGYDTGQVSIFRGWVFAHPKLGWAANLLPL